MSQQLTLETNRHIHSYLWTLHSVPMIPRFVIIKLCDHHYKVPSKILCQSSRFFDALIRFKTVYCWNNSNVSVSITNFNNETSEIEIIENKEDAFKNIIDKLSDQQRYTDPQYQQSSASKMGSLIYQKKQQQQQQLDSLDFLFDCIIVCSKYFFDYLERFYSDEFVNKLRKDASEYAVTDIILPQNYQQLSKNDRNQWLSMLEMYRLAKVYNLDYLSCEIQDLIREKRAYFLKRLRNTYYFW